MSFHAWLVHKMMISRPQIVTCAAKKWLLCGHAVKLLMGKTHELCACGQNVAFVRPRSGIVGGETHALCVRGHKVAFARPSSVIVEGVMNRRYVFAVKKRRFGGHVSSL